MRMYSLFTKKKTKLQNAEQLIYTNTQSGRYTHSLSENTASAWKRSCACEWATPRSAEPSPTGRTCHNGLGSLSPAAEGSIHCMLTCGGLFQLKKIRKLRFSFHLLSFHLHLLPLWRSRGPACYSYLTSLRHFFQAPMSFCSWFGLNKGLPPKISMTRQAFDTL